MKAKLYIVVLKDYENNLVQAKDNNANEVDEMVMRTSSTINRWQRRNKGAKWPSC